MRSVVLAVHVTAGVLAVLLGPPALWLALRRHRPTAFGVGYHAAVAVVCIGAAGLTVFDFGRLWFFVPIAAVSYLFVWYGDRSARSAGERWWRGVLRGYGGAWIALWTAILVVSATRWPVLWFVPPAVGTPLIEWLCLRPRSPVTQA
jgi:hypothetical protein